ncbi:hypothetical protein [Bergeyella cardium]|mgnify:FL=1|uniref:hypothetical protein n=1 Tax=Bergeyella cardium TaxID=1585976 RepID=UPI000EA25714|nr:hypothetical protein [Bergeyella cardium]
MIIFRGNFLVFLFLSGLLFISCQSDKKSEVDITISIMNATAKKLNDPTLSLQEVKRVGENEILMRFQSKINADKANSDVMRESLLSLVGKIIWSDKQNIKMLNDGINFKVEVKDDSGKVIISELINKANIQNERTNPTTQKHNEVKQMLEVFNNNLPIVDSASGVKITQISVGVQNDLIYTAIVPHSIKQAVKRPEAKSIIKEDMSKNSALKKILTDMKPYDISTLKYQYRDENGALLQEVEMTERDFSSQQP